MVIALQVKEKHHWSDEEWEIVRRDYRGTNASAQDIASYLSMLAGERITKWAVKGQVQRLGLARITRRSWSPEEDEKLVELIHRYAPCTVARKLKRSINSVVVRSKRLHLSRLDRDGWFTKTEVCQILGVDHKLVQLWIDTGCLRASWHNGHQPQKTGSATRHIEEADLRDFVRHYPTELTGRNVDLPMLVEILAGVE